ncbi:hypothetical protein [Bacillus paranthracis]|uniref:hypothetical protein n=1 Tax=Bacillus paranthracis TaxID=2026186 RepID=UPI002D790AE3|nr:hypothetical protein [Bacillus paranthracis]
MKEAIAQIKQLIKYHESERDRCLAFYDTPEYKEQIHPESDIEFIKNQTSTIYSELIDELNRAVGIIEQHDSKGDIIC